MEEIIQKIVMRKQIQVLKKHQISEKEKPNDKNRQK